MSNWSILTVSREFGSGGRTIAKSVAEKLGVPCYDKELVDKIALETGFSPEYIEEESEYSKGKSFLAYAFNSVGTPNSYVNPADYLWSVQRKIILELAKKGPCVILGRCSDYILKDRNDCFNVFIHANRDFRAGRILQLYGQTDKSALARVDDRDARRRVHYKYFTDQVWGMAKNYNLSLDSSVLGSEYCIKLLTDIMRT